jgi:hypothetical protein
VADDGGGSSPGRGNTPDPAGARDLLPDLAEGLHAVHRGRNRDDRAIGQVQGLGELVPEPVGVDEGQQDGRGQDDEQDAGEPIARQREVTTTEQPGRPGHRDRRQQARHEPGEQGPQRRDHPGTRADEAGDGEHQLDPEEDQRGSPPGREHPGGDGQG